MVGKDLRLLAMGCRTRRCFPVDDRRENDEEGGGRRWLRNISLHARISPRGVYSGEERGGSGGGAFDQAPAGLPPAYPFQNFQRRQVGRTVPTPDSDSPKALLVESREDTLGGFGDPSSGGGSSEQIPLSFPVAL